MAFLPNRSRILSTRKTSSGHLQLRLGKGPVPESSPEQKYLKKIKDEIKNSGGRVSADKLGQIPKPPLQPKVKLSTFLKNTGGEFHLEKEGTIWYVSLRSNLDDYLDLVAGKVASNSGRVNAATLGTIPRPPQTSNNKPLTSLLKDHPGRFAIEKVESTCFVSLADVGKGATQLNRDPAGGQYSKKANAQADNEPSSMASNTSENALEEYLDWIKGAIVAAGGKINSRALLALPKPQQKLATIVELLEGHPELFRLEYDGASVFVSLAKDQQEYSLDDYLDEVQCQVEAAGGRVDVLALANIGKPDMDARRSILDILKNHNDRFQLQREGYSLFVSVLQKKTGDAENVQTVEGSFTVHIASLLESTEAEYRLPSEDSQADSSGVWRLVDTVPALVEAAARIKSDQGYLSPDGRKVIAVDLEGAKTLEVLQVATARSVFLVDCQALGTALVGRVFRDILGSNLYIKLMHDVHKDAIKLAACGIHLEAVLDTQLVAEYVFRDAFVGLNPFLEKLGLPTNPEKRSVAACMNADQHVDPYSSRPLSRQLLRYAAFDVICLLEAFEFIFWGAIEACYVQMLMMSSRFRIMDSLEHGTKRAIGFDPNNGFRSLCSAELIRVFPGAPGLGEPLVVQANLEDLPMILPPRFHEGLFAVEHEAANDGQKMQRFPLQNVSDIMLDVGSRPHYWLQDERMFLHEESSGVVLEEDIDYVVEKLGFGGDGRAALPGSLNRISAMKGKDGNILGITIRLGRPILNCADLLLDFLLGSDKSILILGKPASGKTSLIRDIARRLSQTRNVVAVDKSNEIGGDGSVPHKSLGFSRRMMVPQSSRQEEVMIECVENHAPQVMVIDEIGRRRQVEAARTVKDRGVRIIASAHGDLCGLIDNPVLNGLVGGIDTVTVGDDAANDEAMRRLTGKRTGSGRPGFRCHRVESPPKVKTQRVSQPIFDVIVEVTPVDKNAWKIIPNTARAVDEILDGLPYHAHMRFRDPVTGAMFFEFASDSCSERLKNR